jgi:hypothetical protein
MDRAAKARMQIRVVLVVWRLETARLARLDLSPADRLEWEDRLRARSLALLDGAQEQLDGAHAWHSEVRRQLLSARAEVNRQVA